MKQQQRAMRSCLFSLALCAVPGNVWANDIVTLSADASANAGYSHNPFLVAGSSTGSGFVQIQGRPELDIKGPGSDLSIYGSAQYERYFEHYLDSYDYNAGLDYKWHGNAKLNAHAYAKYDNGIIGNYNLDNLSSGQPSNSGSDLSLFGTRDRRQTVNAGSDLSYIVSEHGTVTANAYYIRTRYDQIGQLGDYNGYGGGLGYSRQISSRLQIGLQGSFTRYNYINNPTFGHTMLYSPQVLIVDQFSPYWTLQAAIGASFVDNVSSGKKTTLTADVKLCRKTDRTTFCLNARQAALPTGGGGTQNELLTGVNYSYRISARKSLNFDVSYIRNSGISQIGFPKLSYLRSTLGYNYALTEKIGLTVSGRYGGVYGFSSGRSADYGGQVGVALKLGARNAQ